MEQNRIEVERTDGGVAVVALSGEHDLYTAPAIRDRIAGVLEDGTALVIDLTPSSFIDSSVLRVLLEARREAHERVVGFAVALGEDGSLGVRSMLEVTGLIGVFPVLPARKDALRVAASGDRGS
jgi:anti-sigma B factor antagonist